MTMQSVLITHKAESRAGKATSTVWVNATGSSKLAFRPIIDLQGMSMSEADSSALPQWERQVIAPVAPNLSAQASRRKEVDRPSDAS
jgi:hypothetical protein